jgi:adenosylcobinamide kinase / adenosylcobinamide-phosphate guanylyltransferase
MYYTQSLPNVKGDRVRVAEHPALLTLILGGARSGKSRHAEGIVTASPAPWIYIATAQALDDEMRRRIDAHRARRGTGWITVEAPIDLAGAVATDAARPVLVDCLTLWVSNLLLGGYDIAAATGALDTALNMRRAPTVLVANEVGLGIVPDNALSRAFRDHAGLLHQHLAARADSVLFLVAGLPMRVK